MTQWQLTALALRLLAIYAVFSSLLSFSHFFFSLASELGLLDSTPQGGIISEDFSSVSVASAIIEGLPGFLNAKVLSLPLIDAFTPYA